MFDKYMFNKYIERIQFSLIIIAATITRCTLPGLTPVTWDESRLLYDAMALVRHGRWVWLTANQATFIVPNHSPLNIYFLALPYLVSPDPIVARLFGGLLGVATVVIMAVLTRRYFGRLAGFVTGMILAVSVSVVPFNRFIWNPNLAHPFIALYLFTGLLGYYEGKRWAQALHWILLACIVQFHPGNILLAPLTLVMFIYGWQTLQNARHRLLQATALGVLLATLTFIPYLIGLGQVGFFDNLIAGKALNVGKVTASTESLLSLEAVVNRYSALVSGTNYEVLARTTATTDDIWPDLRLDTVLWVQTLVTLGGIVWLVWRFVRKPRITFPGVVLVLAATLPLLFSLFIPFTVEPFYIMALVFPAVAIQGVVIGRGISWISRYSTSGLTLRGIGIAAILLFAAIVGVHGWLNIAQLRSQSLHAATEAFRAPMSVHRELVWQWALSDSGPPNEIVILTETTEGKYGPTEQERLWLVMTEGYPVRLLRMPQGIPVADSGTVVVSPAAGTTIPDLFGTGQFAGTLSDGSPMFRWIRVEPEMLPVPTITPVGNALFANGARIRGVVSSNPPQAGSDWLLTLLWYTEQPYSGDPVQFSVRLLDSAQNTLAQSDFASLHAAPWHIGDTVIQRVTLPIPAVLPEGTLTIRILMYRLADQKPFEVLDSAGNPTGVWVDLSVR